MHYNKLICLVDPNFIFFFKTPLSIHVKMKDKGRKIYGENCPKKKKLFTDIKKKIELKSFLKSFLSTNGPGLFHNFIFY